MGHLFIALQKGFIGKTEISRKTKMTAYEPTLTYDCESWDHSKRHYSKIQALEMRYLTRIQNNKVRKNEATQNPESSYTTKSQCGTT